MGLAEKRAVTEFENNRFPQLKTEIEGAAGFAVPIEVDWTSLAVTGSAKLYADAFPDIYFLPLIRALKSITADDLGREGLQGALKKIIIKNESNNATAQRVATFKDGVLTIDHRLANVQDRDHREKAIRTLLESSL